MDAELVDDARLNGVLAAPVAEDVPGDLRRTQEDTVREKPNDLLSAIKRGANLRKVSDAPPAEPPKTQGRGGLLGNEVDKILNLRAKIAAASESSSSDSGSDWD